MNARCEVFTEGGTPRHGPDCEPGCNFDPALDRSDQWCNKYKMFDARLESLRGVAALAVVVTHAVATLPIDGVGAWWALALRDHTAATFSFLTVTAILNAGSAVVLFFVLSGYVLTLSLMRDNGLMALASYAIRRAFRLLPPMWVSIVLFMLAATVAADARVDGTPFWDLIVRPLTWHDAVTSAMLRHFLANPVIWTMYVEIVGSAVLPLLVAATAIVPERARWLLLGAFAGLTLAIPSSLTTRYLVCFEAGVIIALLSNHQVRRSGMLLIAGLAAFVAERYIYIGVGPMSILLNTSGSIAVVTAVIAGAFNRPLSNPIVRYIGRISYSVYLLHLAVLAIATPLVLANSNLPRPAEIAAICALTLAGTIVLASFSYALFERPSMRIGRRAGSALRALQSRHIVFHRRHLTL